MSSINKVILTGNLGQDPKIQNFQNGGSVANFSIAVTEKGYTTQSGTAIPDRTDWMNIVCMKPGLVGVIQQYVHKGDKVAVVGKIRNRTYDKDGVQHNVTEIVVDDLEMLTSKQQNQQNQQQQSQQPVQQYAQQGAQQPPYQQQPAPYAGGYQQQQPQSSPVYEQPPYNGGNNNPPF